MSLKFRTRLRRLAKKLECALLERQFKDIKDKIFQFQGQFSTFSSKNGMDFGFYILDSTESGAPITIMIALKKCT
uniref:Uncharacterized protein n=1 Tax=Romanomermis culicivorax TaxID=13658 RepID=A0A915K472_ROMCU